MSDKGTETVYQIVTDKIIATLKKGEIPWHKPWNGGEAPSNLITKIPYKGINVWLLAGNPYASPYYLSLKQVLTKGGRVKKEEFGKKHLVVFYKFLKSKKQDGTNQDGSPKFKTFPILRYYNVYNVEQCEGVKYPQIEANTDLKSIDVAEKIITNMPNAPVITHDENRAVYYPGTDSVVIPKLGLFDSAEEYYATTFHELVHSTGHKSRIGRDGITHDVMEKGSYSKEELIAEIGAAFLANICGIDGKTFDNSVAYVQGWMKRLEDDNKLIVRAASAAQRAADYIQGKLVEKSLDIPQEKVQDTEEIENETEDVEED